MLNLSVARPGESPRSNSGRDPLAFLAQGSSWGRRPGCRRRASYAPDHGRIATQSQRSAGCSSDVPEGMEGVKLPAGTLLDHRRRVIACDVSWVGGQHPRHGSITGVVLTRSRPRATSSQYRLRPPAALPALGERNEAVKVSRPEGPERDLTIIFGTAYGNRSWGRPVFVVKTACCSGTPPDQRGWVDRWPWQTTASTRRFRVVDDASIPITRFVPGWLVDLSASRH